MSWAGKIYLWMTRFNTIALTGLILFFIGIFIYDRVRYSSTLQELTGDRFGSTNDGMMPFSGQEMKVPGGTFVSYYPVEDAGSYEWDKGQNITIVDVGDGSSHKILSDNDPRAIINWELIEKGGANPRVYLGYVAWAATKIQFDQGRADLLISAFPNIKQHTLAENIKYTYLPKLSGNESVAIIIWPEEDRANFVSFDLTSGEVIEKKEIDLPKMKENFLSLNNGLPDEKFTRFAHHNMAPPSNEFGFLE